MYLSIAIEGEESKTVFIDQDIVVIGRSSKASIQLRKEYISRFHIQIRKSEYGELFVTDLGSSNGTFINHERISPHEEIMWHTFLPLDLGHKILITLIDQNQNTSPVPDETDFASTVEQTGRTKTKTKTKTITTLANKRVNPSAAPKKSYGNKLYLLIPFIIGAVFLYLYNSSSDQEKEVADIQSKPTESKSSQLTSTTMALVNEKRCLTELEKNYCFYMKMSEEKYEGTVSKENILYLFLNFEHRLKNVQFDPSFSFAEKKDQITYLMAFFLFGDVTKYFASKMNIKEVLIIDTSSVPSKINQVMKVKYDDLTKLSTSDVETIKSMILNNRDKEMFKNVINPLITLESAY